MLRAHHAMLTLIPALLAGYTACAGEDASDEDNAAVKAEASTERGTEPRTEPTIIGTFRDDGSVSGIAVLTLKMDWTFHLEEAVECIKYPCKRPEVNGVYKYATIDGVNALALYDGRETTTQPTYLKYIFKGNVLYVAPVGRYAKWQALTRSEDAWCDLPRDCVLQDLHGGTCLGEWACASNVCNYTCDQAPCELDGTC
jgi:hypothetical protein